MDWLIFPLYRHVFNEFKWDSLKVITTSRWVYSSYVWIFLVPILAKIISPLPETINISIINYQYAISIALPFSWQFFFYGSICISFGLITFFLFCPGIIKIYHNPRDYDLQKHGLIDLGYEIAADLWKNQRFFSDDELRTLFSFINEKAKANNVRGNLIDLEDPRRSVLKMARIFRDLEPEDGASVFIEYYKLIRTVNLPARMICGLWFIFGAGFFAIVTIQSIHFSVCEFHPWLAELHLCF